MNKIIEKANGISGAIEVPGDKSISHRALIIGSIANGDIAISNLSTAVDVASTASCLSQIGVAIDESDGRTIVSGRGLSGFDEPENILDCGNSGTTVRLLSGLLAGQPFYSVLTGDESLRRRPMRRIINPLQRMGAVFSGRYRNRLLPLTITGRDLHGIEYVMPVASAQVKTAILLAGLFATERTTAIEDIQSRNHTELMLEYLGAKIETNEHAVSIEKHELTARDIFVPGDISSAVYFIAAAILTPGSEIEINNVGLNPTRTGFLNALKLAGAEFEATETDIRNNEPIGTIKASTSKLKPFEVGAESIPSLVDEIPLLALLATQADGTTTISGAEELRFKESDRLLVTAEQLSRLGADITEKPDGLIINGPTQLVGAEVDAVGDHRIAMTLAIAGLIADGQTEIKNADAVDISFPEFFDLLDEVAKK